MSNLPSPIESEQQEAGPASTPRRPALLVPRWSPARVRRPQVRIVWISPTDPPSSHTAPADETARTDGPWSPSVAVPERLTTDRWGHGDTVVGLEVEVHLVTAQGRNLTARIAAPEDFSPCAHRGSEPAGGIIGRNALILFLTIVGGAVAAALVWSTGPATALLVGAFTAVGTAAALHELLRKGW